MREGEGGGGGQGEGVAGAARVTCARRLVRGSTCSRRCSRLSWRATCHVTRHARHAKEVGGGGGRVAGGACLAQRLYSLVADEGLLDGREQLERLEQSRCVRRTAHVLDEVA